jgi:hypothetical protein
MISFYRDVAMTHMPPLFTPSCNNFSARSSNNAQMTDDILALITGDSFRAFIPKSDSPVRVNQIDAHMHALQDGSIHLGFVEFVHATTPIGIIGQIRN